MFTSFYTPVENYLLFLKYALYFSGFCDFINTASCASIKIFSNFNCLCQSSPFSVHLPDSPTNRCGFSYPTSRTFSVFFFPSILICFSFAVITILAYCGYLNMGFFPPSYSLENCRYLDCKYCILF